MRRFLVRRPSPALVVALLALVVALGGTGVAATSSLNGKMIKKSSIPGDRLRKDTVTGKQVRESTLAKVRAAALADTATTATTARNATNATTAGSAQTASVAGRADVAASAQTAQNADKVGGVTIKQYAVKVARDAPPATVLEGAGVRLKLSCASADAALDATNVSGADDMLIRGTFTSPQHAPPPPSGYDTTGTSNVDAGETVRLFEPNEGRGSIIAAVARDGGPSMTVVAVLDDSATYGTFDGCSITGNATISG